MLSIPPYEVGRLTIDDFWMCAQLAADRARAATERR